MKFAILPFIPFRDHGRQSAHGTQEVKARKTRGVQDFHQDAGSGFRQCPPAVSRHLIFLGLVSVGRGFPPGQTLGPFASLGLTLFDVSARWHFPV